MSLKRLGFLSAAIALSGCMRFTPFDEDPPVEHVNQTNLTRLRRAGPAPFPAKIVVIGDTHDAYDALGAAVDSINQIEDLNLVLVLGDLSDRGLQQEFTWTWEELDRLRVPYLTLVGNHDALSNGTEIYKRMFGPLDYSFVYANRKIVMLNSNRLEFPDSAPNRDFIERELSNPEGAQSFILAAHQRFEHPDDLEGGTDKQFYASLFQKSAVEMGLNGHLDAFDFYTWQGKPILQAGTFQTQFYYTILTLNEVGHITAQRCRYGDCEPVTPSPEVTEPGVAQ